MRPFSFPQFSSDRATYRIIEADDYCKNLISSSKTETRALLLNTVVYGNPHKLHYTDTSASSLKSGFHSVGAFELCDSTVFGWANASFR